MLVQAVVSFSNRNGNFVHGQQYTVPDQVGESGLNAGLFTLISPGVLGLKSYTVGPYGAYPDVPSAIAAIAPAFDSLVKTRITKTQTITVTNGSAVVTGSGTSWATFNGTYPNPNIPGFVGDLWKPQGTNTYYRIKSIDSNTQFTLFEPYIGTTITATSTTYSSYYIDRVTLFMQPGYHRLAGVNTALGLDIVGQHGTYVVLDEIASAPATSFAAMYDTQLSNLVFSASDTWGDMDGLSTGGHNAPAGSVITHKNLLVRCANLGQNHSGGNLRIPLGAGCTVIYDNCVMESAKAPGFSMGQANVAPTNANTRAIFKNGTEFRVIGDGDTNKAFTIIQPGSILIDKLGTFEFINAISDVPNDLNLNPLAGSVGTIYIAAACLVKLHGHRSRITNSNASGSVIGLQIDNVAATVEMFGCDIEATGQNAIGIQNDGGTVTVRNSRVSGTQNSVNNISGTVNIEKAVRLSGPVAGTLSSGVRGTVTLNGATPVTVANTSVHAQSLIHLSRQVGAGTLGQFGIGTITANTSFTIVGQVGDTSVVMWELEH